MAKRRNKAERLREELRRLYAEGGLTGEAIPRGDLPEEELIAELQRLTSDSQGGGDTNLSGFDFADDGRRVRPGVEGPEIPRREARKRRIDELRTPERLQARNKKYAEFKKSHLSKGWKKTSPFSGGTRFERWAAGGFQGAARKAGGVPLVGKPLRNLLRKISRNPGAAAGTLAAGLGAAGTVGAMVLPDMVQGAYDDTRNLYSRMTRGVRADEMSVDEQIQFDQEVEYATRELMRMQEETEAMARINEQRLMQMEPALANQILAGRRLPRGAMVIGGKPRTDLLREFAMQMAQQPAPQGAAPTSEVFP